MAAEARRLGVDPARILITPTGVEVEPVPDRSHGEAVRHDLGLGSGFVLGWVGSFRPFHAVHRLVEAVAGLDGVTLLLVGDGPERPRVQERARELGARGLHRPGGHADLPRYLAAMDAAAVAPEHGAFHYSPLKLAEYLVAALPVVAPDVDTVASRLIHDHTLLVAPDDDTTLRGRCPPPPRPARPADPTRVGGSRRGGGPLVVGCPGAFTSGSGSPNWVGSEQGPVGSSPYRMTQTPGAVPSTVRTSSSRPSRTAVTNDPSPARILTVGPTGPPAVTNRTRRSPPR